MAKAKPPFRIVWRPMAEVDLDTIIDSIARGNPNAAKTFGQELRGKTLPLAQQPKMGRTGRPDLPAFARELVAHRNYIVFYRVLDGAGTVEVLRVKHAAQQMP
ncbi:type II toxin-antitoxin system RelE/ParE family toxin [Gluconacetobacter sp. 1c LMG 22058]|uniref:Type II toxin-antitoxin system RelE/ParE family toxin n=1 Tax=Gluconacetobacter dulcium TaxID=2729096 RepID=A0A7W4K3S2_9PROT|nr:type II toxin-antitoxin system RelE/ParE family toxin [Gluconacetobacter dulcium]MBB2199652.1 type II toxin-antitoxin system RelE/ParE family toxin [Gluconacetobacter dulcium]